MAKRLKKSLYKQDGVDVPAGDLFSEYAFQLCKGTYSRSAYVKVCDLSRGNFRGPRGFNYVGLPEGIIETGVVDGVGTKTIIINAAGNYEQAASNLIAMTAMDITRYGGLPMVFLNIYDVCTLGGVDSETFAACKRIMNGLYLVCSQHRYVMFTGECAELGVCVGSDNPDAKVKFNWGGTMLGVYHPAKMILGDTLRPGQVIIALRDDFRSNGISSVRRALAIKYGAEWWKNPQAREDVLTCASPAKQYDRFLNEIHGWFNSPTFEPKIKMHLIVHLSGGAFESKLGKDMLKPLGLSAELDNLFSPPPIMKKCARWREMSDKDCYNIWNGGQGAVVVVDEEFAELFCQLAKVSGIEAQIAGKITENTGYNIAIHSKFSGGKMLYY